MINNFEMFTVREQKDKRSASAPGQGTIITKTPSLSTGIINPLRKFK